MLLKGEDIKKLIPQRYPFIMVDEFEHCGDQTAATALTIRKDNYFMLPDGTMAETGLMEHIAQSAAALAGYLSLQSEEPHIGLIGEVKHFECKRRPREEERVETGICFGFSMGNVTLVEGKCSVKGEEIAAAKLKIFMQ